MLFLPILRGSQTLQMKKIAQEEAAEQKRRADQSESVGEGLVNDVTALLRQNLKGEEERVRLQVSTCSVAMSTCDVGLRVDVDFILTGTLVCTRLVMENAQAAGWLGRHHI